MWKEGNERSARELLAEGELGGVADVQQGAAISKFDRVGHGGRRYYYVTTVLVLQALPEHVHVQQAQESALFEFIYLFVDFFLFLFIYLLLNRV